MSQVTENPILFHRFGKVDTGSTTLLLAGYTAENLPVTPQKPITCLATKLIYYSCVNDEAKEIV